jgi:ketosteroid isomerase-like protein
LALESELLTFPKGEDPWSREQVAGLLRAVEDMFHRRDIEALVHGFTEDCVVRFSEQPELRGRDALRKLFTARLSRQKNYRLQKTLRPSRGTSSLMSGRAPGRTTKPASAWRAAGSRCGGCETV